MSLRRPPASGVTVFLLILAAGCGGDGSVPTDTGGDSSPSGDQNQAPDASITAPADGATFAPGEAIGFEGTGDDPEDGTLSGGSLEWRSDADGVLGGGASLSRDDLSEGEHTVTLAATDGDGATGTDQVQISVEAGGSTPSGSFMPLEEGRRWRYVEDSETTVCASSTGCDTDTFVGRHFVVVEGQETFRGRSAWRVRIHSMRDDASSGDYAYGTRSMHLSQDGGGLAQWIPSPGEWRQVLSTSTASIQDGTFFLVDGPPRDPDRRLAMGTSSVTVPFGSFSTLEVAHEYRQTGQHAPEDIFDSAEEHYADQVGMVLGTWDYHFDDNDPAGTDVITAGSLALTDVDTGPFPDFVSEVEPNDTHGTANSVSPFSIAEADIRTGDRGAIIDDAEVGCTQQVCVHPDVNGDKVIQDWFRLDVSQQTDVRIVLDFLTFDSDAGVSNDLDLYLFEADGSGGIQYLARAAGPAGEREQLVGTIEAGTYFIGIQAWDTPSGRIPLWLATF